MVGGVSYQNQSDLNWFDKGQLDRGAGESGVVRKLNGSLAKQLRGSRGSQPTSRISESESVAIHA